MKLLFVCVLVLLWLVAVTASRRDSHGHRGRQQCDYNMKRYISNLRKCLADERADTDKLKEEIEDARAENDKLKEEIEEISKCCKYSTSGTE